MKKHLILYIIVLTLFACNGMDENNSELLFIRKIDSLDMENFKIPDSVNTSLVLASYYDKENQIQTLFVYDDLLKKSAKKIDYLKDSTSVTDQLSFLKLNEFRSERYKVDYVIHENSVSLIYVRTCGETSMPQSKEYRRTDRD